jgi:hypothetical protein
MATELLPDGLWELVGTVYPSRQGQAQGRKAALSGQGMSHRHCIRPAQWYSVGDAAARDGLWFRHELLAAVARLARTGIWQLIHYSLPDWLARYGQIDWSRAVRSGQFLGGADGAESD